MIKKLPKQNMGKSNLGWLKSRFHFSFAEYRNPNNIKNIIENGKIEELKNITKNTNFYKNHPTLEHFIPLLIAFGSAFNKKGRSFNSEMIYSNISMRSFIFDEKEVEK